MKKISLALFILLRTMTAGSQSPFYHNPILAGFYPDPSICKVENDYYLINSSFAYFPGLPVFHSRDLVNWKLIGHAMNRPSQMNLEGAGVSRGLFAPTIRYHKGTFYIVCTLIDQIGNFVITATDPAGPWSDPVALKEVNGIDPSLFFDEDDRAWLTFNSIAPDNKPLYDGHRTIRMVEFDWKNLKVIGKEEILINGGTDILKRPVWIEGPHHFKKDGWYFLSCAEGGTAYQHSQVIFRSRSLHGPYHPWHKNPVLTQRHLDRNRPDPVTTTGHADLTQAPDGSWWAVFLGCRPFQGDFFNTGRETYLLPVKWEDGWPVILEGTEQVALKAPTPAGALKVPGFYSGNFLYRDDFNDPSPDPRWIFLRTPLEKWHSLSDKKGWLTLQLREATIEGKSNPSFMAQRQQHLTGEAQTLLSFKAQSEKEKAGLLVFQNERHYFFLCQSLRSGKRVVELYQGPGKDGKEPVLLGYAFPEGKKHNLELKVSFDSARYHFWYREEHTGWKIITDKPQDGTMLSTATAGGFVGTVIGLYAVSPDKAKNNKASFDYFQYMGDDSAYK